MKFRLFVVSGPSGSGKTTLVKRVLKDLKGVQFSVSHTTRPKRDSEKEGKDYYFVDRGEFNKMAEEGAFVERARVYGSYYGTSFKELQTKIKQGDLILDIDVQGAEQIKKKFRDGIFVFVLPPDFGKLKQRLEKRGEDSPAALKRRLAASKKEIRYYSMFDYVIVNDSVDKAARELESIIISHRCWLQTQRKEIELILRSFE